MTAQLAARIAPHDAPRRTGDIQVTERVAEVSPRSRARMIGVVYVLYFLTAVPGQLFVNGGLVVSGGAGNTIAVHEPVFRLGFALGLISIACYIAVTALFYQLFRPVNRTLALLAAFFSLVGCVVMAFGSAFQVAPLLILRGDPYLSAFSVDQRQALARLFLTLNTQAGAIALVFFGLFNLLIGYLIARSTFLPRILGALMACSGLGWLTFLAPPLATALAPYIEILGVLTEASLMLWLLVRGVNAQRRHERARAAVAPIRT